MAYKIADIKTRDDMLIPLVGMDFSGEIVKGVDKNSRILTMVGTDETKDRDGDIITMKGWQLENYLKNPVFLWAHDYSSVPLGATQKLMRRKNPSRLEFVIKFPTEGLYPFADMILDLYAEKIINASSVGFIPLKWEPLEKEGKDEEPISALMGGGRKYIQQELLELSGCAVPSNPNALQNAVKSLEDRFANIDMTKVYDYIVGKDMPEPPKAKDDILEELNVVPEVLGKDACFMIQVPENYDPTKLWKGPENKENTEEEAERDTNTQEEEAGTKNAQDKQEKEGETIEETQDKEPAQTSKTATFKYCVCPECGYWEDKTAGDPCSKIKCPECGTKLEGSNEKPKAVDNESKSIGGDRNLPLNEDTSWSANDAISRMRVYAGGPDKDKIDWKKYRKGFVWYDSTNPEAFGSYKLPFADVENGVLKAKWGGVYNAMAAVLGSRGGVAIPEAERKKAYNFLKGYYKKFDKPVPDYKEIDLPEDEVVRVVSGQVMKVGAVLNRRNKERLKTALEHIQQVLDEAETTEGTESIQGTVPASGPKEPEVPKVAHNHSVLSSILAGVANNLADIKARQPQRTPATAELRQEIARLRELVESIKQKGD